MFILFLTKITTCQSINAYELLITEIMCDPKPSVYLPEEEFIEIYNNSDYTINLSQVKIQFGTKLFIPKSYKLHPDSFFVLWDKEIPALKNTGDSLKILFGDKVIHSVNYKPNMHLSKFKRNGGWSLELVDFSKPCLINNNWISSISPSGGTPGYINSNREKLSPYPIVLKSFYPTKENQLSLFFNVPIESIETPFKHKITDNHILIDIPKIDSNSIDSILIINMKTCYDVDFGELNLKYGFPKIPKFGDIVINELLFNPDNDGSDFIEIYNYSSKTVDLSKLSFCRRNNNAEFENAFILKANPFLLLPNEYFVVCSDKLWLEEKFPRATNIIESDIPPMNNDSGNILLLTSSAEIIDEVNYKESWHFTELIKNENVSLEKINPAQTNTASSWTSASFSYNYATPGYVNSNFIQKKTINNNFVLENKIISPNGDSYNDQLIVHYNLSNSKWKAKIRVINSSGITIKTIHPNIYLGNSGIINWDGRLENKLQIKPGIYALHIGAYNSQSHEKINKKILFYVNGNLK